MPLCREFREDDWSTKVFTGKLSEWVSKCSPDKRKGKATNLNGMKQHGFLIRVGNDEKLKITIKQ